MAVHAGGRGPGHLSRVEAVVSGHTFGPELWPQPTFAASTGLALSNASVSGNALHCNGSGSSATATATGLAFNIGDTIAYDITFADPNSNGDQMILTVGGVTAVNISNSVYGRFTGTVVATSAGSVVVQDLDNAAAEAFCTACSIKKQLT